MGFRSLPRSPPETYFPSTLRCIVLDHPILPVVTTQVAIASIPLEDELSLK